MVLVLQVINVFLVAIAMSLAVAHALELPGKLRLDKDVYIAVQPIYYPGFTYGGLSEPLAIIATLILLLVTPVRAAAFGWTLAGLIALIAMHAVYWTVTHPVNKFWLKDQEVKGLARGFFSFDLKRRDGVQEPNAWESARDRWEYSHVLRSVFGIIALVTLIVAVALAGT